MVWRFLPKHEAEGNSRDPFMVIFIQYCGQWKFVKTVYCLSPSV